MSLSLRERKYAQTKAALMRAVLRHLSESSLDEILIKRICEEVEVSETTFYNYFPTKIDVLVYFVAYWSVRVAWEMQQALAETGSYLRALERLFAVTAAMTAEYPRAMVEILAVQMRPQKLLACDPLTPAEYTILFADQPGADAFVPMGIDRLLEPYITGAINAGELIADVDELALIITLSSLLFGIHVFPSRLTPVQIGEYYQKQLEYLWRGLRWKEPGEK